MKIVFDPKKEDCVTFDCLWCGECFIFPEDQAKLVYMVIESKEVIDLGSGQIYDFNDKDLVKIVETTLIVKRKQQWKSLLKQKR
mgnify:CR=1 FL=1